MLAGVRAQKTPARQIMPHHDTSQITYKRFIWLCHCEGITAPNDMRVKRSGSAVQVSVHAGTAAPPNGVHSYAKHRTRSSRPWNNTLREIVLRRKLNEIDEIECCNKIRKISVMPKSSISKGSLMEVTSLRTG